MGAAHGADAKTPDEVRDAKVLREAMIAELREMDVVVSDRVGEALASVPRHRFVPGEPLEVAYAANSAVPVKRDSTGRMVSCMSAAFLQAAMLEQAQVEPGMRVLELGSGGYNAALLAELVGADGQVTTVDIDGYVTRRARGCLDAAGYQRVHVAQADAEHGLSVHAPYDRIVVTFRSWDIPPSWLDQLAPAGRIVVPLHFASITRSVAFDRAGDTLTSHTYRLAAFVPAQGAGSHVDHVTWIDDGVALRSEQPLPGLEPAALKRALYGQHSEYWSGAAFDLPDELQLFLLTSGDSRMAMLHGSDDAIDRGTVTPAAGLGVPTLVGDDSLAWRIKRATELPGTGGFESGVIACGVHADTLADRYLSMLRHWATSCRYRNAATIRYLPTGSRAPVPDGWRAVKRHGTVVVSWP